MIENSEIANCIKERVEGAEVNFKEENDTLTVIVDCNGFHLEKTYCKNSLSSKFPKFLASHLKGIFTLLNSKIEKSPLEDYFPVRPGEYYLCDRKFIMNSCNGTVLDIKNRNNVKEVRYIKYSELYSIM